MELGRQVFYHKHAHTPTDDMYFDSDLGSEGGNYKVTNWPIANRTPAGFRLILRGIAITFDPAESLANTRDAIDEAGCKIIYDGQDRYYFHMAHVYRGPAVRTESLATAADTPAVQQGPASDFFEFGPLVLQPDRTFNVEVSFDTALAGMMVSLLCDVERA